MVQVSNSILLKYQPSLPLSAATQKHLLLPPLILPFAIIRPSQLMSPKTRIKAPFPKLAPELREEQEMPKEDKDLWDGPPILRIDLPALLTQKEQIMPYEVVPSDHLSQVELILHHATQSEEVERLMGVVIIAGEAMQGGTECGGIAIGQIVTRRRTDLFVPSPKLAATGHVRHRPEVNQPATVVPVNHDVHLFHVTMDQLLLGEEEQSHADILHHLHLARLGEPALAQIVGVVLQEDFSVVKGLLSLRVTEILGDVGADPIADVLQEVALILQGDIPLPLSHLQPYFPDQTAIGPNSITALSDHTQIGHSAVDTGLGDIAIDAMNDLRIPTSPDGLLSSAFLDLDGSEYQLGTLLFSLRDILQQCLHFKSEQALCRTHPLLELRFTYALSMKVGIAAEEEVSVSSD